MLNVELYDLLMEAAGAFYGAMAAVRARIEPTTPPVPPLLQVRGGRAESPGWFLIQAAEFDPEPLTVAGLRVRDIYAAPRTVQAVLEMLAGEQWLERNGEEYALTSAGRGVLDRLRERPRRFVAELAPLPAADLSHLEGLLGRLISASLASSPPPGPWCLAHSRRRAPPAGDLPLVQIRQYLDDFNAFRDDAHMAAWQPYTADGATWEAFALVCSGEAGSGDAVFAQLVHRGHARQEYAAALATLAARGWLVPCPDAAGPAAGIQAAGTEINPATAYQPTDAGREVRARVEAATDTCFYAPWRCLTADELAAVPVLLTRLRDGLQALAA